MKNLKKIIDDFLKRLAAQNKEQFGSEKLDCCNLDRPKNDSRE
ncbi:MAG TPA: LDCC motif putative metal-binding protein [Bacillota bacterium]|nr:LDCC motif putative metal-binding protein [Clostridiaceae bacterium]HNR04701.1 LDCC motif putative metal-binding protein [Bacillota bacterium]HNT04182.1 LDCC motif putative metal-binding protein [Bacillota bacterium]HPA54173.1 LDCC motif putative metal-binding protein [Bacillota bacterium]HPX69242.1 LDCC motif putative metal-binding protein [Bacillota bacterium]